MKRCFLFHCSFLPPSLVLFLLYALLISLHIFSLQILLVSLAQKSLKRKPPSKLMFHISYPTLFTTSLGLKIYNQILPSPPPNSSSKISTVSNASSCGLYAICHAASFLYNLSAATLVGLCPTGLPPGLSTFTASLPTACEAA